MKYWGFWLTMFFLMVLPAGILAEAGVESRKIMLGTHQPLSGPMKTMLKSGEVLIYFQYLNDQEEFMEGNCFSFNGWPVQAPTNIETGGRIGNERPGLSVFRNRHRNFEICDAFAQVPRVPHFSSVPTREESRSLKTWNFLNVTDTGSRGEGSWTICQLNHPEKRWSLVSGWTRI